MMHKPEIIWDADGDGVATCKWLDPFTRVYFCVDDEHGKIQILRTEALLWDEWLAVEPPERVTESVCEILADVIRELADAAEIEART